MRILIVLAALSFAACAAAFQAPMATEDWTPVPHVAPGASAAAAPADATVLFDGASLAGWESVGGGPARWRVEEGAFTVAPGTGDIRTTAHFGDVQLHIEWRTPALPASNRGQDRGNSGVFLQERYEVQVLDSFENTTYSNGQAGAIYKQHNPLVNASRAAGEWQSYDIVFIAPRFDADGAVEAPARMTVFHNGVLIHHDAVLTGETVHTGAQVFTAHGEAGLRLQDHGHLVSFRNIWARRL